MKGLANIPLILGIILLVIAVPVTVLLVQQNANPQNRAYEYPAIGSVDCTQIFNAKLSYCGIGSSSPNQSGVPCSELDSAISKYCTDNIPSPAPTTISSKPTPTLPPQCSKGQTKCFGRILFSCINNSWNLTKTCPVACTNGTCVSQQPPIIIKPPTNPVR